MKPLSKKPAPKTKRPLNKWTLISVLLILIVALGVFATYRIHQNKVESDRAFEADKARFAKVEADMEQTYASIIASVGTPAKSSSGKNCGYTSTKFEKGTLYCMISYEFSYALPDGVRFVEQAKQAGSVLNRSTFKASENSVTNYTLEVSNVRSASLRLANDQNLGCDFRAEYTKPELREELSDIEAKNVSAYFFQCSAAVKKPIYSLAE